MSHSIIYHDGAYNLYTTIGDGAWFEGACTLEELTTEIRDEWGEQGIKDLATRLERAHKTGCSARNQTLAQCISCNRAGPNETELSNDEFIKQFLTLPIGSQKEDESTDYVKQLNLIESVIDTGFGSLACAASDAVAIARTLLADNEQLVAIKKAAMKYRESKRGGLDSIEDISNLFVELGKALDSRG